MTRRMTRRSTDAQSATDAAVVEHETRAYTPGDEAAVVARDEDAYLRQMTGEPRSDETAGHPTLRETRDWDRQWRLRKIREFDGWGRSA